jgi:glycosyltransferase involved in cell wall biosynthesis
MRRIWENQQHKMRAFEQRTMSRFDWIVAVSERDASFFRREFGAPQIAVIPTGVDLDYFQYSPPARSPCVVFCGGMDWAPNVDGITFLMDEVWPLVIRDVPEATMKVVGRSPPDQLIRRARSKALNWEFTGFVEDVRSHVREGSVYAVPLRVGGGTRLKIFEAMALGRPIVSTAIGVEGLPVQVGEHYLAADSASEFATALVQLLRNRRLGIQIASQARRLVEDSFSFRKAARVFEGACLAAMSTERLPVRGSFRSAATV